MLGTFEFGATTWDIETNNPECISYNSIYFVDYASNTIKLRSIDKQQNEISKQIILQNLYAAWVSLVIKSFRGKYDSVMIDSFLQPFGASLLQITNTLKLQDNLEGNVQIGGNTWTISMDNQTCDRNDSLGECYNYTPKIIFTNQYTISRRVTNSSILCTIYHELVHAALVNLYCIELNEDETFVNLVSVFYHQFVKTLKFEDECKVDDLAIEVWSNKGKESMYVELTQ